MIEYNINVATESLFGRTRIKKRRRRRIIISKGSNLHFAVGGVAYRRDQ